jgi:hypothetical protein
MWPRVIEGMLGAWLLLTPFIFRMTDRIDEYVLNGLACGAAIAVASLLSFWRPARHARFLTLALSLWLVLHGYFSANRPGPPAAQNELVIGLTLLLLAIMPNEVNDVPDPWRRPHP